MYKKILAIAMVIGLGVANVVSSYSEVKENKEEKYKDMMKLFASSSGKSLEDGIYFVVNISTNKISEELVKKIIYENCVKKIEKIKIGELDGLNKEVGLIYDTYLTHNEIKELLESYYNTPTEENHRYVYHKLDNKIIIGMTLYHNKVIRKVIEGIVKELREKGYTKEAEGVLTTTKDLFDDTITEKSVIRDREGTTRFHLSSLRSAIAIYYGNNYEKWPENLPKNSDKLFPGLKEILSEKITGSNKVVDKFDGTGGWYYNSKTGEVILNLDGKDSKGVEYRKY